MYPFTTSFFYIFVKIMNIQGFLSIKSGNNQLIPNFAFHIIEWKAVA